MNAIRKYVYLVIFFLLLGIAVYLPLALVIAENAEKSKVISSDAIFVLGARSYIDGSYNPCLESRMKYAASLYNKKIAPKVVVSGGTDREDNANEAEVMKKMAVEMGVFSGDVIMENAATSTYENLTLSNEIFKQNNIKSIVLVTEPFHITRASLVARKLGIPFSSAPAIESSCWTENKYFSRYFLKEPFAILVYKIQGKL